MAADYIPTKDLHKLAWLKTFARTLSNRYSAYMIAPVEAAAIVQAVESFEQAMAVIRDPGRRTVTATCVKDETRNVAVQLARHLAMRIKQNMGISCDEKIAIGVRPVNPQRTKISVPITAPALCFVAATNGAHTLNYQDSIDSGKRAKPFGATHLQVFRHICDTPRFDPAEARYYGQFTRTPFMVEFEHADSGKYCTYFARWISRRGEVGNWSVPVYMRIAA